MKLGDIGDFTEIITIASKQSTTIIECFFATYSLTKEERTCRIDGQKRLLTKTFAEICLLVYEDFGADNISEWQESL